MPNHNTQGSDTPNEQGTPPTTTKTRDGVVMIITTTQQRPAIVDYNDILEAAEITPDEDARPYWVECDGFEHTRVYLEELPEARKDQAEQARSGVILDHDKRTWTPAAFILRIEAKERAEWGSAYKGASKQVEAEARAVNVAHTVDGLGQAMRSGDLDTWNVDIDFQGYTESLCGCYGYWYAQHEIAPQLADEVASAMEADGYTVENKPQDGERRTQAQKYRDEKARTFKGSEPQTQDENCLIDRALITRSRREYQQRHARRHQTRPNPRAARRAARQAA